MPKQTIGPKAPDEQRRASLKHRLDEAGLDALICALPMNVLLLSGYWPVVGTALAIAFRDGRVKLLVPEDEEELARGGRADSIETFKPGGLHRLTTAAEAVVMPLRRIAGELMNTPARIGYEQGEASEGSSYAAMNLYQDAMSGIVKQAFPSATVLPGTDLLKLLRSVKTGAELSSIGVACRILNEAFKAGAAELRPGMSELEGAACFRKPLSLQLARFPEIARADGFTFCMSGPNSALAKGAYARSRTRVIETGDLVLVHCNSYADGYWTDLTRTYSIGRPDSRRRSMYEAIFAAREAALQAIAPNRKGSEIDHAAREVLNRRGFGDHFTHSTGHGVGLEAIDANSLPRLHPESSDILEPGMVFNVEPAIYIEDYGGIRHCDLVTLTEAGPKVLTPFQGTVDDLTILA